MSILRKHPAAKLLQKLSDLVPGSGIGLELALCHGRVIVIGYKTARAEPSEVCPNDIANRLCESSREAQRQSLTWLQDDVRQLVAESAAQHVPNPFGPGLTLSSNGSARVLAMKLHLLSQPATADSDDAADADFLLERINVSAPAQIRYIYERTFPGYVLSAPAEHAIERAFEARTPLHA